MSGTAKSMGADFLFFSSWVNVSEESLETGVAPFELSLLVKVDVDVAAVSGPSADTGEMDLECFPVWLAKEKFQSEEKGESMPGVGGRGAAMATAGAISP